MKPAVVNASPLIVLARAGYLDLLPMIFSSLVVPRGVVDEITAGPAEDPLSAMLAGAKWLSVRIVADRNRPPPPVFNALRHGADRA